MKDIKYKYILIFLILSSIVVVSILKISSVRLEKSLDAEKILISTTYKSVVDAYKIHADIFFENVINQDEILKIFASSKHDAIKSRDELYSKLKITYESMQKFKLKQLHFHLNNNDSFLRFHRPEKFGDNLSDVRATLKYVNEKKECISGFEEGRIFNGYRFVCPLFYEDEHIGSVETSISMNSIMESMSSLLDAEIEFIMDGDVVRGTVFKDELSNYAIYEASTTHYSDKNANQSKVIKQLFMKDDKKINNQLDNTPDEEIFSFYDSLDYKGYVVTIVDINRALSQESVAHFIILREHDKLEFLKIQEKVISLVLILFIGLISYFMFKTEKKHRELLDTQKKFKKLFDLQNNIIVVTDGKKLKMANNGMCDFFGVKYLKFFTKYHNDINDRFIESEHYFNQTKINEGETWIDAISRYKGDDGLVIMHDLYNTPHAFNVAVSKYDSDDYIVLFTDISDTVIEKMNLSSKIVRDTLTDAYNREFFNTNINSIINNLGKRKKLGVAILDIDKFKAVNDTYGHDAGDTILIELTALVKDTIRENDFFIRWGGEEFVILLTLTTDSSLEVVLEHIRKSIEAHTFSHCGNMTCSIGATYYKEDEDINDCIKRGDISLYEAKDTGRNKVIIS